ncbi:MAG: diheme cytochrome c-553 [Planctomycetota bacterium]
MRTLWLKKRPVLMIALVCVSGLLGAAAIGRLSAGSSKPGSAPEDEIARGRYLTQIMACNDCHTPWIMTPRGPEPDPTRLLSGHPQADVVEQPLEISGEGPWGWAGSNTNTAFSGPWGVSFTANLTPDRETGLGEWTAETFIAAIRTGRHEGRGRPILPPMPYPMYRQATDADLRAVFAYLQSIPAIQNRVPQPIDAPESQ